MSKKLTTKEFIEKASKKHYNKYDYSKTEYKLAKDKVEIICPIHGPFFQSAYHHLYGSGCYKCKAETIGNLKRDTLDTFIKKANKVHNNKYNYSLVDYKNNSTKVEIICPIHGPFKMRPSDHYLLKQGCVHCKQPESKGVIKIKELLTENNIEFIQEYKFDNCRGKIKKLPFDFYLPNYNTCIEFQGSQHYIQKWSLQCFLDVQVTDQIKKDYCLKNNITLLEVKYNDNIEEKIKKWQEKVHV